MPFQVQIRKDGDCVEGSRVRIEHAGGSEEGVTNADGLVTFAYDRAGSVTIWVEDQRRGTYDYAETQSVTVML